MNYTINQRLNEMIWDDWNVCTTTAWEKGLILTFRKSRAEKLYYEQIKKQNSEEIYSPLIKLYLS